MITIPDMEKLPKNCHVCEISYWDEHDQCWCPWHNCTVDYHGGADKRMNECPLVESEEQTDDSN